MTTKATSMDCRPKLTCVEDHPRYGCMKYGFKEKCVEQDPDDKETCQKAMQCMRYVHTKRPWCVNSYGNCVDVYTKDCAEKKPVLHCVKKYTVPAE